MPATAAVSHETYFENLKNLPIFDDFGNLRKLTDPIWKTASKLMPETSLKNIYIFVYQNRKDIKNRLLEHQNIIPLAPPKKKKKKPPAPTARSRPAAPSTTSSMTSTSSKSRRERKPKPKHFGAEMYDDCESEQDDDDFDEMNDEEEVRRAKRMIAQVQSNDIHALMVMKHTDEYRLAIHQLNYAKFALMYWDREQIKLWQNLKDLRPVALIILGDIVSNEMMPKEVGSIFMYALAANLEDTTIVLGQMISESTELRVIKFFLNIWMQKCATPLEIVLEYSINILDAASLAFNVLTFDEYNTRCFKYLNSEPGVIIPGTLLQIDIISLIKVVDSWPSFETVLQPVKDFYLCSIMYLSTVSNYEIFADTVISVLAICQSPCQTLDTESRRAALWDHLTADEIQLINQRYIEIMQDENSLKRLAFLNNRPEDPPYEVGHEIYTFIEGLKNQAYGLCDFQMELDKQANVYYCPVILDNLVALLAKFPAWTKIIFTRGDCSDLVSQCANDHLNYMANLLEPMRPSEFFKYHMQKIKTLTQRGNKLMKLT